MNEITPTDERLISQIKLILDQGKVEIEEMVLKITLKTAWDVGHLLHQHGIEPDRTGKFTIIAQELGIATSKLGQAYHFYTTFPGEFPGLKYPNLNWSHFRTVLSLESPEERRQTLDLAQSKELTVRELSEVVKEQRGKSRLPATQTIDEDHPDATATLQRATHGLHLYKAEVLRVVDGDTIDVRIDVGFTILTERRLRLRGIDTPEMRAESEEERQRAQQAKEFVETHLPQGVTIVLQTFRVDLHGRYVCDVFYLAGSDDKIAIAEQGEFLNQQLVNAGLAKIV